MMKKNHHLKVRHVQTTKGKEAQEKPQESDTHLFTHLGIPYKH